MPAPTPPPADAASTTPVSEKSTKAELWEAYRRARVDLEKRPVAISDDLVKFQRILGNVGEAKAALVGTFDATLERLTTAQTSYQAVEQDLDARKAQILSELEQDRLHLDASIAQVRQRWADEQADRDRTRSREQDSYDYTLKITRRDGEAAYAEKAKAREAALAAREAAVAERELKLDEMQRQVDRFPSELDAATKAAKDTQAKETTAQHQMQLKDQRQAAEHIQSILKLKLDTAEAAISAQSKQLSELQRQLDASQNQLKDMALAAITFKAPSAPTAPTGQ